LSIPTSVQCMSVEGSANSRYGCHVAMIDTVVEPAASRPPAAEHPIIFFDGVCVLCNGFVDRILHADRRGIFRFAPLQGETARAPPPPLEDDPVRWSLLFLDERGLHTQSDASLEVYRRLGGAWWLLSLLRVVPRAMRDALYRVVVRNRYRWFG